MSARECVKWRECIFRILEPGTCRIYCVLIRGRAGVERPWLCGRCELPNLSAWLQEVTSCLRTELKGPRRRASQYPT